MLHRFNKMKKFTLAFLLIATLPAEAAVITMTGLDSRLGDYGSHSLPFNNEGREISYYDPSLFSGLSGSINITGLGFRDRSGFVRTTTFDDLTVVVSSLPAGSTTSLAPSFDDLHGADRAVVYSGSLVLNQAVGDFEFGRFSLTSSFLWDTSKTLVVELINAGPTSSGFSVDAELVDPDQRAYAWTGAETAPTALRNRIPVIELTYGADASVPTPLPLALFGIGLVAMLRRATRARLVARAMLPLLAVSALPSQAAVISMNGYDNTGGGASHTYPFYSSNTRDIQLYDPSWFNGLSGTVEISAIGFRRAAEFNTTFSTTDFEIAMSSVSLGSTITTADTYLSQHGADRIQAYDGALTIAPTADTLEYFQITLQNSFIWDTSKMLVIDMYGPDARTNPFRVDAALVSSPWRGYSSGTNAANGVISAPNVHRLDILQLTYDQVSGGSVPLPASIALFALGGLLMRRTC